MKLVQLMLAAAIAAPAFAQDISVSQVGTFGTQDDYIFFGTNPSGQIAAYAVATTSCNVGTIPVEWLPNQKRAPVIGTNLFRVYDGRIEQLGYSFVKYAFCAADASGGGCPGACQNAGTCDFLGVNCADTYWAGLNDGQNGGAKWEIDPTTGAWPAGSPTGPSSGSNNTRGRLQVKTAEMAVPGSIYVSEGQYVSRQDHLAGNARNNYGWRKLEVPSLDVILNASPTIMGDPAIYAWQAFVDDVQIADVPLLDEGGPGVHGWYFLGSRAWDLGGGLWRYEYALQNGNSNRAAGSFTLRIPCDGSLSISDPYFHDLRQHSGTPFSNVDWTFTQGPGELRWATDDFATDPDANAIRWGTMYNFGFTADRAPGTGIAEIGIFTPGSPEVLHGAVSVPLGEFAGYCSANPNSTGVPATIAATGSPYVDVEDLTLSAGDLPPGSFGYFLMSRTQDFVPDFGASQGNLCLGAPQVRFDEHVLNAGAGGTVALTLDFGALPQGTVFQPGDDWNFQYWYRDQNPGFTSNTTAGVSVTFCQ